MCKISIHAPREGSDGSNYPPPRTQKISIHAPREGSDGSNYPPPRTQKISIHAPREGSDVTICGTFSIREDFYPRSPRGERQRQKRACAAFLFISIHAPREGSDGSGRQAGKHRPQHFYPRSPRGERLIRKSRVKKQTKFLSTLPARGATEGKPPPIQTERFLSTLPARGATESEQHAASYERFLSTLPARGATTVGGFSLYAV